MCHGPFFLMEQVTPVFPGEGRFLTGEASARASEEAGVQSDVIRTPSSNFSTESQAVSWTGRLHAPLLVAVFSLMYSSPVKWKSWCC